MVRRNDNEPCKELISSRQASSNLPHDLHIHCGETTFHAHMCLLRSRTSLFRYPRDGVETRPAKVSTDAPLR